MLNPWAKKLQVTAPDEAEIKSAVRNAIGQSAATDRLVESSPTPTVVEAKDTPTHIVKGKLSKLVADDFPFDESQLAAINGLAREKFACMTGAAGTGKTTCTKKLVDDLQNQGNISRVDMRHYWKQGDEESQADGDRYEMPSDLIPAIALVGFTGRSAQMIKKNFPRDWHGNIMTIHRLLAFVPEYYEDFDDELQEYRTKMRFVPTYTAAAKLPWDIIIIDEAGMVGLELWHQLLAATKPSCRIYMIGDINQLPPVHGRSVFGFAMAKWPSFELTHIHRQVGQHNPIVDNAWRILKGQMPKAAGAFQMVELKSDSQYASRQVRAMIPKIQERGLFEPNRDTIITAINGKEGSRGVALGQLPLNEQFSLIFNPQSSHPRYIIDGGRERKYFAVGDKVMATKNDHEAGITNGMTGIITKIADHAGYSGDLNRFGLVEEVNAFLADAGDDDTSDFNLSIEDLHDSFDAVDEGIKQGKEKRERGPSSHIVTVRFGEEDHGFEIDFATLSEVGSLATAYVVTCHKMQGGESPTVVIICHESHKSMLYREWLYTAVTRASEKCILLYTPLALRTALNKQNIKGATLKEKVHAFNLLQSDNGLGVSVKVSLPDAARLIEGDDDEPVGTALTLANDRTVTEPSNNESVAATGGGELVVAPEEIQEPEAIRVKVKDSLKEKLKVIRETHVIRETIIIREKEQAPEGPIDADWTVSDVPKAPGHTDLMVAPESIDAWLMLNGPEPLRLPDLRHERNYAWPAEWAEPITEPNFESAKVEPKQPVKPVNAWAARLKKG